MGGTIQQSEGGFVPSDLLLRSARVALPIGIVDVVPVPYARPDGDIIHCKSNV
jgi:hypothetical protein